MAANDPRLTDLDLLTEGVFGGPLPSPRALAAIVGDAERLVAVQAEPLPPAPPPARWLRIHPGIGYLLWAGASPLPRLKLPPGALVGQSQQLDQGLVHGVQQALVSLRRRELAALARHQSEPPSFQRECEARALLVGQLRSGGEWRQAWAWWTGLVLLRHQNQINAIRRKLVEVLALVTRDIDRDTELSYPFRSFIDTIYDTYALTPLMNAAELALSGLSERISQRRPAPQPVPLARALAWATEHLGESSPLRHAAHAAGVSPEHLARLAKAHLGTTFLEHLTALRLAEARRLLAETADPVNHIAARCGFGTTEHFQRTFKRVCGTSPGAWRLALKG
jgi:AraC-like DNA-binding protein